MNRFLLASLSLLVLLGPPSRANAQVLSNVRLSEGGIPLAQNLEGECFAWDGPYYDHHVYIDLRVTYNGNIESSTSAGAWYYAQVELPYQITHTGVWSCEADFYHDWTYYTSVEDPVPVYLYVLDITIQTFIPEQHIPCPNVPDFLPWVEDCYEMGEIGYTGIGDDRMEFHKYGSARTRYTASIIAPIADVGNHMLSNDKGTGMSMLFDLFTSIDPLCYERGCADPTVHRITQAVLDDWTEDTVGKVRWAGGRRWLDTDV